MRPLFKWNLGRRRLSLGERTLVMGVLNVTPDSFSDGGLYLDPEAGIAHGLRLLDEGADILDIGGESTRPGTPVASNLAPALAGAVSAAQELGRVLPVIEGIRRLRPDAILSIDTCKSAVAVQALQAGVEIVNDVSGLTWDPEMAAVVAWYKCGVILMHTRGLPHEWPSLPPAGDIVGLVCRELKTRADTALEAGIAEGSIVLDPGFGFGKKLDENYPLLSRFGEFQALGFPLLAAVSRKGFLARTVVARLEQVAGSSRHRGLEGHDPQQTANQTTIQPVSVTTGPAGDATEHALDHATLAATVAAALAGAHLVRVHAVRPAIEALAIADAILRARPVENI
jgi:dihydropteroate synthase